VHCKSDRDEGFFFEKFGKQALRGGTQSSAFEKLTCPLSRRSSVSPEI
jgi:hypothetical protein